MCYATFVAMIIREVKLKTTVKQSKAIDTVLWQMISVYNTALMKCFIGLKTGFIPSPFDLMKEFKSHGKKSGINQNGIQECCVTVRKAFDRWLLKDNTGKRFGRPRRKSQRNKVTSITYGQASEIKKPKERRVNVPGFGKIRCSKNELPEGRIKGGRLVKRASGYYFQFIIDIDHSQELNKDAQPIGLDPGFSSLLTTSDGKKFENPRELRKTALRLAQAQRGKNKKLVARIHERIKRQRQDRNHKISHEIVKKYSEIYASKDSFKGMQKQFGKSISETAPANLLQMISYKSQNCGRKFVWVNSKNTTRACSVCLAITGPTGLSQLGVRTWNCPCGAEHDRDVNAARVILRSGQVMPSTEKITK